MKAALLLDQGGGDPAVYDSLRKSLLGISFLMIALAALSSLDLWGKLAPNLQARAARAERAPDKTEAFQPIRTQEELSVEEVAPLVPRHRVSRIVSRLVLGPDEAEPEPRNRR
ncbi:MAG: hypothetical protein OIF48_09605 [Silicimonas sp.]|nr:hypothetical protein [Silicimonas sp.]